MNRPVIIINFKNYEEILGHGAVRLATVAEEACRAIPVDLILAPPVPTLSEVAKATRVPAFSQGVVDGQEGKSTGAVIPEALKAAGCSGSIVNHSESRVSVEMVRRLLPRMQKLGLSSCVCAQDGAEAAEMARLAPEFVAVEPPELIGSGIAVSRARPELLQDALSSVRRTGYKGKLLCGAGIVTGEDVREARRLGMEGVLVASSVVKAKDWAARVRELAASLV